MPSFAEVEQRLARARHRLDGQLLEVGTVDGYPVLCLEVPALRPEAPRIWLNAGIHGEEPGSVAGCLRFVEEALAEYRQAFSFTVLPCLSPWGYERGERYDARGRDPNRLFRDPEEPIVEAVRRALARGRKPRFAIDMHEDSDFASFYMYEIAADDPPFAAEIIRQVAQVGPIADGLDLNPPIRQGLVVRKAEDERRLERLEEVPRWPIAFYLYRAVGHTVTLETPVLQPLWLRAEMQVVAVRASLDRLLALG